MTRSKVYMGNQRERVTCTPAISVGYGRGASSGDLYKLR
jgi:hypothetical protein